jgi:5'-3' exonuclease
VGAPGYEADDVIGTLARTWPGPVDVVTGDRDLFQVIDDDRAVRVLYIARGVGRHERLDCREVVARYRVLPQQYADFAVMRGDASDGLPGVAGIGAKTAADLLATYGDLEGIIEAAVEPGGAMTGESYGVTAPESTERTPKRCPWPVHSDPRHRAHHPWISSGSPVLDTPPPCGKRAPSGLN